MTCALSYLLQCIHSSVLWFPIGFYYPVSSHGWCDFFFLKQWAKKITLWTKYFLIFRYWYCRYCRLTCWCFESPHTTFHFLVTSLSTHKTWTCKSCWDWFQLTSRWKERGQPTRRLCCGSKCFFEERQWVDMYTSLKISDFISVYLGAFFYFHHGEKLTYS